MTPTKEDLQERAQLVRIHASNCEIEHPSADELNFRWAIMKKLAACYGLKELRGATIDSGCRRPGLRSAMAASIPRRQSMPQLLPNSSV